MNERIPDSPESDMVPLQRSGDAWSRMSTLVDSSKLLDRSDDSKRSLDPLDLSSESNEADRLRENFEALTDTSALPVTVYPFLRQVSDRLAKSLALDLRKKSGALIDVAVIDQVNMRMGNAAASIPVPSLMAIIQNESSDAPIFAVVDGAMAALFFDLLLGGAQIRSTYTQTVRNFSMIETRLFQIFSEVVAISANVAFEPVFPIQLKSDRIETNPRFLPMGKTQDSVVKIRLLVQCNMRSGFVDLYLSARFLAPIEARLRPAKQKDNVIIDPFWQKHLQERLLQSRVELWANLSEFVIPLHRLRSLKKGDVLPLEKGPDSLIDLVIDSRILARGRMGRSTGKIAVKIEDTHVNSMPKDF